MRTVVIGGYGNFGARICRELAASGMEVIAAGRHPRAGGARLDLAAPDFPGELAKLAPGLVIHCAGPFQSQDYRVGLAALHAGAHYLDLADGRRFVADFAKAADPAARAAGRLALSGASTLPALSSAVIDRLRERLATLDEIRIAIAPGQRAPRGEATLAAVLGYAGRPFPWLSGGAWRDAWGWQELSRVRIAGVGTRWGAACDVPDLELLPARYPGVRTVEFRAALELGSQQLALWLLAWLRRRGATLPLERRAKALARLASWMDALGGERAGMLVTVTGVRPNGSRARLEWHLAAGALIGPEIPCLPAVLLARKLAEDALAERGAHPCMGFLSLAEFEREFPRWGIATVVKEMNA
jgi:NAD(P)-dependent dehydrogenase (short-subunit alcohol dehydrogenase family)